MAASSTPPPPTAAQLRKDPAIRAILLHWRSLTGPASRGKATGTGPNRSTLIACSGGADSCALAIALAAMGRGQNTGRLIVAHIIHDLRPESEALADRDTACSLAAHLGLEFIESRVRVKNTPGNTEAAARTARYAALTRIAHDHNCPFIATAHHADDQLETVLMSLLRGTAGGGAGIRGMAAKREIGNETPVRLIRPMLTEQTTIDRTACHRICTLAGIQWREDATNTDTSRLRSALRHRVIPILRELRPDVARRAITAASFAAASEKRLNRAAARLLGPVATGASSPTVREGSASWPRAALRRADPLVLGAMLRLARRRLCGEERSDRISKRMVDAAVRAIRDTSTEPRQVLLGHMTIQVTARSVNCSATPEPTR